MLQYLKWQWNHIPYKIKFLKIKRNAKKNLKQSLSFANKNIENKH